MGKFKLSIGGWEAEPLSASVSTPAGPLFLSRVLPGRWAIQRPGAEGDAYTPTWDGARFTGPKVTFFEEGRLEAEIGKAVAHLGSASPSN